MPWQASKETKVQTKNLQYQETDWEFIMRIASLCNGYLYPDVCSYKPHFYCGLPQENAVMIQKYIGENMEAGRSILPTDKGRKRGKTSK